MNTSNSVHAVALLSGGLDSLLATKLIIDQGLNVQCLHMVSPFFGKQNKVTYWESLYNLTIESIDISKKYIQMLQQRPKYGFGKVLNPCIDCKILMMNVAYNRMKELGASFIISGEVIGQRPMSQRKETLSLISNNANIQSILLRPLCAQHLSPTEPELSGLVDRTKLLSFFGRGRKEQLQLANHMGIKEIPTPAGGCKLAEKENAKRYWLVLTKLENPTIQDFTLANVGRQYWYNNYWVIIGRNKEDNHKLETLASPADLLITLKDGPGPTGLARQANLWDSTTLYEAASLVASYSHAAVKKEIPIEMKLTFKNDITYLTVIPSRTGIFTKENFQFEDVKNAIKNELHSLIKT